MEETKLEDEEDGIQICDVKRRSTSNLRRRKTWPRLVPCLNDIIYWDEGDAEEIGEGFYSNVYKFSHHPSGHTVVIKVSKDSDEERSEEDQKVMMKEIKLLKKLSHDNIIKYLGLCAKGGRFHPVLEFINGGSLDTLLKNHNIALSWSEKIGFCRDVSKGMEYLHANDIFHRDLKSSNCLIRHGDAGTRSIVVADFGLAREVPGGSGIPRKMSVVGTAFWMAPEVLNGELYSSKVDVFSYGIVACEILARVISDPDELPRTSNYGLDLEKFSAICQNCPKELLHLVKDCTEVSNPLCRPSFEEIVIRLEEIESTDDAEDYDIIDELLSGIDDVTLDGVTEQCDCNGKVQSHQSNRTMPEKTTNLSGDSGFEDCNPRYESRDSSADENGNFPAKSPPLKRESGYRSVSRKKVSFREVSSLLSWRRRFEQDVIHEEVAPSRGMTLKRSASLPDLKHRPTQLGRGRASTVKLGKKGRPKSMFCENSNGR